MDQAGLPVYRPVKLDRDYLAEKALDQFSRGHPGIWRTFSAFQKMRVLEEFRDSISSLEESLAIGNPALLIEHSCWAKVHLTALHFPKNHEHLVLVALGEVLKQEMPPDFRNQAEAFIAGGLAGLDSIGTNIPSCITPANPHADIARSFLAAVIAADQPLAGKVLEDGQPHALRDVISVGARAPPQVCPQGGIEPPHKFSQCVQVAGLRSGH